MEMKRILMEIVISQFIYFGFSLWWPLAYSEFELPGKQRKI